MKKLIKKTARYKKWKVIFVGAHPDDIELGCGGTVARFVQRGYDVRIVYASKGGKDKVARNNPDIRVRESTKACGILGVEKSKISFGGFEDTQIPDSVETIHFLERFCHNAEDVYAVFVPSTNEVHQDHRAVANASITAFRHVPRIFAYESPSTTAAFSPTSFVDITDFLKTKWKALRCHESQIAQRNKVYMEYRAMLCISSFRGRQIGTKYAEAFETIKCLIEPGSLSE